MQKNLLLFIFLLSSTLAFPQTECKVYSPQALAEDMDFFYSKVTPVHPLLFERIYKFKWNRDFTFAKSQLVNDLSIDDFYKILAPLLASLGDASTVIKLPEEDSVQMSRMVFPLSIKIKNDKIFAANFYYQKKKTILEKGEEIAEINGITSEEILKDLRKYVSGNTISVKNITVEENFRTFFAMRYGFYEKYNVLIKRVEKDVTIAMNGIPEKNITMKNTLQEQAKKKPYAFAVDTARDCVIFTIRSFSDTDAFNTFADSVFYLIKEKQIQHLIIDVRNNIGGKNATLDSLMNYIALKPYQQYRKTVVRTSDELKAYYEVNAPEKYAEFKRFPIEKLIVFLGEKVEPHAKDNRFTGDIYVWTNDLTSGMAATFAGVIKKLKRGKIIGTETGGTIVYYGESLYYTLPHTGLKFYVSPKRFMQYGNPDSDRGVIPDYKVADKNNDIELFTYDLMDNNKDKK